MPSQCASVNRGRGLSAKAVCQLPCPQRKQLLCKNRQAGCRRYPWIWQVDPSTESFPPPSEMLFLMNCVQAEKRGLSLLNPVDSWVFSFCPVSVMSVIGGGFVLELGGVFVASSTPFYSARVKVSWGVTAWGQSTSWLRFPNLADYLHHLGEIFKTQILGPHPWGALT